MAAITTWFRLHGRSRDTVATAHLAQEIRDPLWMLARQWQLGELGGHDGGSPITARLQRESAWLSRYCPGSAPSAARAVDYAARQRPLDAIVEAEPVLAARSWSLGLDIEAGLQLLRTLDAFGLSALRAAALAGYPFPPPAARAAEVDALLGDDAALLAAQCRTTPSGAVAFARLSAGDRSAFPTGAAVMPAVDAWLAWCRGAVFAEPAASTAWSRDRLEHAFSVGGRFVDREVVLQAPAYDGEALDWHTFDASEASLGAPARGERAAQVTIPTPVRFRAMPPPRTWEFEDARFDLGAVDAGPTDLARLLVLDFALIFGHDWFLMPLDAPVGALTRIANLTVADTFGVELMIPTVHDAAPDRPWHMFQPGGLPGLLLVAPTALQPLRGELREDVVLFRDDGADTAWAVERTVELPSDRPAARAHSTPVDVAPSGSGLRYTVASRVPANWVPLIRTPSGTSVRLVAGQVLPSAPSDATLALGRVLTERAPLSLYDEEVPREGVRITRRYRLARWIDGSTHLWLARAREAGTGPGASHLEYDLLLP